MGKHHGMDRRSFIKSSAVAAGAAFCNILPGYAAGSTEANSKLNLAIIGCANRGAAIAKWALRDSLTNCVALCDVVPSRADEFKSKYKDALVFDDFRKMFDQMGDKIDACIIGTPDHTHFPITMLAMSLGKSVYLEKPLAHSFYECELLKRAEEKYGVFCQMGNQGHSGTQRIQFRQWVESGIIKNVRRVDAFMNNARRWHPWGDVKGYPPREEMPAGMNWDVWAGPAAKHPYNTKYDPGNWRGWYIYGNGAFGDWGPHTLDSIHRFLKLGLPYQVRADKLIGPNDYIYPTGSTIAFEFAARGQGFPAMTINWYDGVDNKPPRPEQLGPERKVPPCGKVIYSDDLVFMGATHGSTLRIIPESRMKEVAPELPKLPESETSRDHMSNFLRAVRGEDPRCNSPFSVAAPLTQMFMLGCIAQRLGGNLDFDAGKMQIRNDERANSLLKGPGPRKGWEEFYKLA